MDTKLTLKQKKFCNYYMKTGNATESAIKAGYSKKTAHSIGDENLRKPVIREYIQKHQEEIEKSTIMSIQERQEWLTNILLGNIKEKDVILQDGEMIEIERPVKLDTILKASEQLNKMQGAYLNKVEVNTKVDTTAFDDILSQIGSKGLEE